MRRLILSAALDEPQSQRRHIIGGGIWDPGLTMHVGKLRGLDDKPHKLSPKIFVAMAVERVEVKNIITADKEATKGAIIVGGD